MLIRSLYLKNFRNYSETVFEFGPKLNVISGPNAQGKTTILEAIYLLMTGRSFRSNSLKELIQYENTGFTIELNFIKYEVEQVLHLSYDGKEKRIFHNCTARSSSSLIGVLPGTLMIPDDVSMVKGQPKFRRRYLDIQLAFSDPLYVHHLTRYQRAMAHRNVLLKNKTPLSIEIWEQEMAVASAYIVSKRYFAIESLQRYGENLLSKISEGRERISLNYKSECPQEEKKKMEFYYELYRTMRGREMKFGSSLVGPHRDDVLISINEKDTRHFASEGQQKSVVASMRFAEWEYLRATVEESPLILIDDLGLSLDFSRRAHLIDNLKTLGQIFVTTTENEKFFDNHELHCINLYRA